MNILYIHQYFLTPRVQGATRSYEFARHLIRKGHKVTMVTSGISNGEHPVAQGQLSTRYETDGIEVVAVRAGYNDARNGTSMAGWQRMRAFMQFADTAARVGKRLARPDIVFATHTPLNVGFTGINLRKHFKIPFVFEVRDLWPEALVNIGALKNPLAVAWLRHWSRKIYFAADAITAASPGMKEGILKYGVPDEKVTVITQGCDLDLFSPERKGVGVRERLGLGDRYAAIYFGAMGIANGLEYAVEAASLLKQRGRKDIVIVLHGAGGRKDEIKAMAAARSLENVVFSDPVPDKKDLAEIVAACDACMTIYRASKEHTWSPNKMFDALSAGKPVLINVPGWLGNTIEGNRCGFETDPEAPASLADKLELLADNPVISQKLGRNGRQLAESRFSRASVGDMLEAVLWSAFKRHGGRS
jgi:glycosyltransferase involved in cell wall biosynthesis